MKKLICILLIIFMTVSFIACASDTPEAAVTTALTEETTAADDWSERYLVKEELPDSDYEGYKFTIYLRSDVGLHEDFDAETETGDIVNDAVYRRNRTIEERFNVEIAFNYDDTKNTTYTTTAVNAILANEDVNDVLGLHGAFAFVYAKESYLLDWKTDLQWVDLEKPWWDHDFADNLAIAGKLFAMTGDISHHSIGATFCMIFNKKLFEQYSIDYPYQMVKDGKWTFDKFAEIVKTASIDLNGDSKMTPEADLYGITMGVWDIPVQTFYSAGDRVITIDTAGVPSLTPFNERTVDIFQKFFDLVDNYNCYLNGISPVYDGNMFRDGRSFFTGASMASLVTLRDMESDIGIIPAPKYNESVEKYYSLVDAGQNVFSVPKTAQDPERTSVILEALCAEGYRSVVPVFFEEALQVKYTRDDESASMLEIIRDGRIFDYGYFDATISWDLSYIGRNLSEPANRDFASFYASREKLALNNLDKLYQQYLES